MGLFLRSASVFGGGRTCGLVLPSYASDACQAGEAGWIAWLFGGGFAGMSCAGEDARVTKTQRRECGRGRPHDSRRGRRRYTRTRRSVVWRYSRTRRSALIWGGGRGFASNALFRRYLGVAKCAAGRICAAVAVPDHLCDTRSNKGRNSRGESLNAKRPGANAGWKPAGKIPGYRHSSFGSRKELIHRGYDSFGARRRP